MPDTSITPKTKRKLPPAKEILMAKKIIDALNKKYPCKEKDTRKFFAVFSSIGLDGFWDVNCTDQAVWRDVGFNKLNKTYSKIFKQKFKRSICFSLVDGSFISRQYRKNLSLSDVVRIGTKFKPFYDSVF